MSTSTRDDVSWERMSNAIERVRARLLKAARALDSAAIDYAVITDAWEFPHVGKIEHLAKEGTGPESCAYRKALADESYVEIEFVDANMRNLPVPGTTYFKAGFAQIGNQTCWPLPVQETDNNLNFPRS